jgi:hypothetical protein
MARGCRRDAKTLVRSGHDGRHPPRKPSGLFVNATDTIHATTASAASHADARTARDRPGRSATTPRPTVDDEADDLREQPRRVAGARRSIHASVTAESRQHGVDDVGQRLRCAAPRTQSAPASDAAPRTKKPAIDSATADWWTSLTTA